MFKYSLTCYRALRALHYPGKLRFNAFILAARLCPDLGLGLYNTCIVDSFTVGALLSSDITSSATKEMIWVSWMSFLLRLRCDHRLLKNHKACVVLIILA